MIIQCKNCSKKFVVKDIDIPKSGRNVKCGYCSVTWLQLPINIKTETLELKKNEQNPTEIEENLSVDAIKASDGKTYKFLGSQWAVLLPSGKTGLFAKKKIGKELDRRVGRKTKNIIVKKKERGELDPSSEGLSSEIQLPDIYKEKKGLGFFGYIFILIIVSASAIGIIKTFEDDWLNYFPQDQYIFDILDEQLEYIVETSKNIITLIKDLINSY